MFMARLVVKSGHQRTCITMRLDHVHQIYADHRRFNNKHNWGGLLMSLFIQKEKVHFGALEGFAILLAKCGT